MSRWVDSARGGWEKGFDGPAEAVGVGALGGRDWLRDEFADLALGVDAGWTAFIGFFIRGVSCVVSSAPRLRLLVVDAWVGFVL